MSLELLQQVGVIKQLINPDGFGSDGLAAIADGNVQVNGHAGLLFVIGIGDVAADVSGTVSLVYSASGSAAATDYGELAGATDAVVTVDTDTANSIQLIELDLQQLGVVAAGKFGLAVDGDSDGTLEVGAWVIPYGGNVQVPSTQPNLIST